MGSAVKEAFRQCKKTIGKPILVRRFFGCGWCGWCGWAARTQQRRGLQGMQNDHTQIKAGVVEVWPVWLEKAVLACG
jgi:hypothetical protein